MGALSAGVGIHLFGQEFNYAWVPYSNLGSAQYFSLDFRFGGPPEEQKPHIEAPKKHASYSHSDDDEPSADYQNLRDLFTSDEDKAVPKKEAPKEQE
jgi:hypothetical protein